MTELTWEHADHSNQIEGFEGAVLDSMNACTLGAWEYLRIHVQGAAGEIELREDDLKLVHQMVVAPQVDPDWVSSIQWRGSWRHVDLEVGGRVCPPWQEVPALMTDWIERFNGTWQDTEPRNLHVLYEHVHPFEDGNGRTGRLLMWLHELLLDREPTLIRYGNRFEYYRWF